jgi:hypothetical protein
MYYECNCIERAVISCPLRLYILPRNEFPHTCNLYSSVNVEGNNSHAVRTATYYIKRTDIEDSESTVTAVPTRNIYIK